MIKRICISTTVLLSRAQLLPSTACAEDAFDFFKEESQAITVASAKPETVFDSVSNVTRSTIVVPEHVRPRVVESMPLVNGRRLSYTVSFRF